MSGFAQGIFLNQRNKVILKSPKQGYKLFIKEV